MAETVAARMTRAALEAFCMEALRRCEFSEADAATTANVLITTEMWGVSTHGVRQLLPLLRMIRSRRLFVDAKPEIVRSGPAWAIVDGHFAMPMVTGTFAMTEAIARARACGIGYVGVRHSAHFGAAGYYAHLASTQGLFGMVMSNVAPCVAIPGSKRSVIGSNPIAYSAPAGEEYPLLFDIATSAVAASKIYRLVAKGEPIPEGWLIDNDGHPTTDASHYPAEGAMMTMAGHKGYGFALLAEIMSAVMTGASITCDVVSWVAESSGSPDEGHSFFAIDCGAFLPLDEFKQRMDLLIQRMHAAPKAEGTERIYVPGEMEWEKYAASEVHGIPLASDVLDNLLVLADELEIVSPVLL